MFTVKYFVVYLSILIAASALHEYSVTVNFIFNKNLIGFAPASPTLRATPPICTTVDFFFEPSSFILEKKYIE